MFRIQSNTARLGSWLASRTSSLDPKASRRSSSKLEGMAIKHKLGSSCGQRHGIRVNCEESSLYKYFDLLM